MSESAAKLAHYALTITALLVATVTLAFSGNDSGALVALGALCGVATGSTPGSAIPRPVVAAGAIGLALVMGSFVSGCAGTQAMAILKPTCAAIRVLHSTCQVVDPVGESQ